MNPELHRIGRLTPCKRQVLEVMAGYELSGIVLTGMSQTPEARYRRFRARVLQWVFYGEHGYCGSRLPCYVHAPPKR